MRLKKFGILPLVLFLSFSILAKEKTKQKFIEIFLKKDVKIIAELALTPEEWEKGLMFRKKLPDNYGMLFVFKTVDYQWFWMKNTYIPLDIIWISEDKKIVYIAENCKPCLKGDCPSYGVEIPVKYVLEIKGGKAKEFGIKVGDRIDFFLPFDN